MMEIVYNSLAGQSTITFKSENSTLASNYISALGVQELQELSSSESNVIVNIPPSSVSVY
jgi:hypothetical protein